MSKSLTFTYETIPAGGGIPEHGLMMVNGTVFAAVYAEGIGYRIVARLGSKQGGLIASRLLHRDVVAAGERYAELEKLG